MGSLRIWKWDSQFAFHQILKIETVDLPISKDHSLTWGIRSCRIMVIVMDRESADPSILKWLILPYLLFVFLSLLYYMGDSYGIMMKTLLEVGTANIIVSIGIIFREIVSVLHIVHFHRNPS